MQYIKQYLPHILLSLYLVEFTWLAIAPPGGRDVWLVENLPIVLVVVLLVATYKRYRFSNLPYFLMAFFLM